MSLPVDIHGRLIEVGDRVFVSASGTALPHAGWFCKVISTDDEASLPRGHTIVIRLECGSYDMGNPAVLAYDQTFYACEVEVTPSCLVVRKARNAATAAKGTGPSGTGSTASAAP